MGNFTFNGISANAKGLLVSGVNTMNGAERRVTSVQIPGRSGNIIFDDGAWNNVRLSYPCAIKGGYAAKAAQIREWLGNLSGGYYRLSDTYNTDEFRLARFAGAFDAESWAAMRGADCMIEFDCKPQRWLLSGETETSLAAGTRSVTNPTANEAHPLLKVTATASGATIRANGKTMTINTTTPIYIDCENMLVYRVSDGANMAGSFSGDFITLVSGANSIVLTNCSAVIKPRWYRL